MPFNPIEVVFPKNRIKSIIRVIHDGTKDNPRNISIAKIKLHSGKEVYGLRHDYNSWNENNQEIGYPTVRPGNPTWFILPDIGDLIEVLKKINERVDRI